MNQAKALPSSKDENMSHIRLKELQEGNHTKLSLLDLGIDDIWVVKMPPPMRAHIWSRLQSPHDEGNVRAYAKGRSTQKLPKVEQKVVPEKSGAMPTPRQLLH